MDLWNGLLEWACGIDSWNGLVEWLGYNKNLVINYKEEELCTRYLKQLLLLALISTTGIVETHLAVRNM